MSPVTQLIDRGRSGQFHKEILQVPLSSGSLSLVRKRSVEAAPDAPPILLVHGFGQNRYSWHLPTRSFANHLADRGFDVFNIDLRGHGRSRETGSPHPVSFECYVEQDIPAALTAIRECTGGRRVFMAGHSLGAGVIYAAAPRLADQVAGVMTFGGVYGFGIGQPLFRDASRLYRLLGGWSDGLLSKNVPFIPVDLIGRLVVSLEEVVDHPWFAHAPLGMWYPGSIEREILRDRMQLGMDRTGFAVLRQMIEWAATGGFVGSRSQIDYAAAFAELDLPLLVISADRDTLCAPKDCYPAYSRSSSKDKTYRKFGLEDGGHWGHVDLICGRRAPEYVWPYVTDWLQKRIER